jgi:hypothetical protein
VDRYFPESRLGNRQAVSGDKLALIIQEVGTQHYLKDCEVTKPRMKYLGISVAAWSIKQFT